VELDATVRELAPKVLGYCILETGDAALAEEISQDTLTALVQRWRRYGPPDSPAAFVFAIARRRSARAVFRRRVWLPLESALAVFDHRANPEQRAIRLGERHLMVQALARLGRADRQVLLLLAVGDVGLEEAAGVLGISLSAVKMRALRARKRLRELLEAGNGTGQRRP
jgi:RNA polymerase sigma-70 factor (ECF subfamily)